MTATVYFKPLATITPPYRCQTTNVIHVIAANSGSNVPILNQTAGIICIMYMHVTVSFNIARNFVYDAAATVPTLLNDTSQIGSVYGPLLQTRSRSLRLGGVTTSNISIFLNQSFILGKLPELCCHNLRTPLGVCLRSPRQVSTAVRVTDMEFCFINRRMLTFMGSYTGGSGLHYIYN